MPHRAMSSTKAYLLLPAILLAALPYAVPSASHAGAGLIFWTRGCPPNGYSYEDPETKEIVKPDQPPFDFDLDGDGTADSWGIPIICVDPRTKESCSTVAENGKGVFLVCRPDPAGPGCGGDYYSPRFGQPGKSSEIGRCAFRRGSNLFIVSFEDADGDHQPDRFLKLYWRTQDAGSKDPESNIFSETAGNILSFSTDLERRQQLIVNIPMKGNKSSFLPFKESPLEFGEATLTSSAIDLDELELGGEPLPLPPATSTENVPDESQNQDDEPLVSLDFEPLYPPYATPGATTEFRGTLTNKNLMPLSYELDFKGINLDFFTLPQIITVDPGQSISFSVSGIVIGKGPVGLVGIASGESGEMSDIETASGMLPAAEIFSDGFESGDATAWTQ